MTGTSRLAELIDAHVSEPWPETVERGSEYGGIDPVMADADVLGFAISALSVRPTANQLARARSLAAQVEASLNQFPPEAQPYFLRVIDIAREMQK